MKRMAAIGLGGNIGSPYGAVQDTLEAAAKLIDMRIGAVLERSPWYRTKPHGVVGQPDFINGALVVETELDARSLLLRLHAIESTLGRTRQERWSARTVDLDLLALENLVAPNVDAWLAIVDDPDPAAFIEAPMLPHPRLHERAFALRPLYDVWPGWVHPVYGEVPATMLARLPEEDMPLVTE